jgi:hypothetical protein
MTSGENRAQRADEKMGFATEARGTQSGDVLGAGKWGSAETHGVAEEGRDETGTRSAEPWLGDYRIRYCLSSEK